MKKDKLSNATVLLHWIVGFSAIFLLFFGIWMKQSEAYHLYDLHKSIGIIILVPVLVRIYWRLVNGFPDSINTSKIEYNLAKIVQYALLTTSILMPIAGMVRTGAGGYGFGIFGLELMTANIDPTNPDNVIAINDTAARLGGVFHQWMGYTMIFVLMLHILGACKHYFINKNFVLQRMLGLKNILK